MSYTMNADDVYGLASAMNADVKKKGRELFFKICPYCGGGASAKDKNTFSVNLDTGLFKCFRVSCAKSGHFVQLARDFNYPLNFGEPTAYKALPQYKPPVREPALKYLMSRGISAEVGRQYGVTTAQNADNLLMFMFRDENGVLRFIKYRKTDFDKNRDNNKEWCESDTQPILYGMDKCTSFKQLVVTEGQLDSLSVASAGISNAVSVPTGATGFTWVASCFDWVSKFEEIVIFGDCEKEQITLVDGFKKHFPAKKIRVVRREDYLGEKDANDILRKYGAEAVRKCVYDAEEVMAEHVKRLSAVESIDLEKQEHIKTGIYGIDHVIGGLYLGTVTLLTGRRGEGKSTLASQVLANALDQSDPNGQPYSVFIYSGELPNYHFKRWLDLQIAGNKNIVTEKNEYNEEVYTLAPETVDKINAWYGDRAYIFDNAEVSETDEGENGLLSTVENIIQRYNTKLILIDNLMTALDYNPKDDLYREQSRFVGNVKKIAMKYKVAVLLIAHPRKEPAGDKKFTNDSVSGSADITNRVDVVMSYARKEPTTDSDADGVISITKNRLTGNLAKEIFTYYGKKSKRICCNTVERDKVYGCFAERSESLEVELYDDDGGIPF